MELGSGITKAIRDGFAEREAIKMPFYCFEDLLIPFGFASGRYFYNDPGYGTRQWVIRDFSLPRRKALPNEPYFNEQDTSQHRLVQAMEYEQRRQELTYITEEEQELARQCIKKGKVQIKEKDMAAYALKRAKITYALQWNCYTSFIWRNEPGKIKACPPPDRKTLQELRHRVCRCSQVKRAHENSRRWIKQQPFYVTAYKQFKKSQSHLARTPATSSWFQWWNNLQRPAPNKDIEFEQTKEKEIEIELEKAPFMREGLEEQQKETELEPIYQRRKKTT